MIRLVLACFLTFSVNAQSKTEEKSIDGIQLKYEYNIISSTKRNKDYYMVFSAKNTNEDALYMAGPVFKEDGVASSSLSFAAVDVVNAKGAFRAKGGRVFASLSEHITKRDRPLYRINPGETFEQTFEFRVKVSDTPFIRFGLDGNLKPLDAYELFRIDPPFPDAKFPTTIADRYGRTLPTGMSLNSNDCLSSKNQQFYLAMQTDGNLCVYKRQPNGADQFVWATMTNGTGASELRLQNDGNLVLYNSYDQPVWSSQTTAMFNPQFNQKINLPVKLVLDDYGKLILISQKGDVVWKNDVGLVKVVTEEPETNSENLPKPFPNAKFPMTEFHRFGNQMPANQSLFVDDCLMSENRQYYMVMQEDGNLVIYQIREYGSDRAVWATKTNKSSASELEMQEDGNLVLYNKYRRAIWRSGTTRGLDSQYGGSKKPVKAVLRNDGKLALYNDYGDVIWTNLEGGQKLD
ncbi:MAG: hypothetical protein KJN68_12820 [Bacteroidia bacterium]|nr:hypothetical protein [Bacteroidia bacterium]